MSALANNNIVMLLSSSFVKKTISPSDQGIAQGSPALMFHSRLVKMRAVLRVKDTALQVNTYRRFISQLLTVKLSARQIGLSKQLTGRGGGLQSCNQTLTGRSVPVLLGYTAVMGSASWSSRQAAGTCISEYWRTMEKPFVDDQYNHCLVD